MSEPRTAARASALYDPTDLTWRVNREIVLVAGGGAALLLQVAHPLVGAGVAEHSNFEADPWGRLFRTLDLTTTIVFGDRVASGEAAARIATVHRRVQGVSADGVRYDAHDPALLLWVWATLVVTAMRVYGRAVTPLERGERAAYYAEQKRFAHACGVPEGMTPETLDDFRAYYDRVVGEELAATPAAAAVWRTLQRPPRVPRAVVPLAVAPNTLITTGLLPPRLRMLLGLPWDPRRARFDAAAWRAIRLTRSALPRPLREFPAARAADRRAGA